MENAIKTAGVKSPDGLPEMLGKYRIVREIGRGGMGVVCLAEDTTLCRMVALKAIFPQFSADGTFMQRFRDEARALASLSHASIVRINSLESINERLFIDMEYIDGVSLAEQFGGGPMAAVRAVEIAAVVLQALAACHARGITHRDIKPSNILLEHTGRVVLTDFGLSQAFAAVLEETVTRSSSSGFFQGTPRYAPPEAWDGVAASPAWDLFSVGAILFEAIAGRPLYDGNTPMAIMKQTLSEMPLDFGGREVSPELRALVVELTAHDPGARPRGAVEAVQRLAATPEGAAIRLDGLSSISWNPPRRREGRGRLGRRGLAVVVASILAVIAAGGAWYVAGGAAGGAKSTLLAPAPSAPQAAAAFQSKVLVSERVDEDALLHLRRIDSSALALDVEVLEDRASSSGYGLLLDAETTAPRLLVVMPSALWVLRVGAAPEGGALVEGGWADYVADKGMLLRWGVISGSIRGKLDSGPLTANLKVENKRANTARVVTLTARVRSDQTDTQIVARIDTEPLVQRLLWKELLPQRERFPWAGDVNALLPSLAGARVVAPKMADPGDALKLDGVPDEVWWTTPAYGSEGRIGEFAGIPANCGGVASARYSDTALYIAGKCRGSAELVQVALCRVEFGDAGPMRYELELAPGRIAQRCIRKDKEIAAPATATGAVRSESDGTSFELRVPFGDLGLSRVPGAFEPWRIVITAKANTAPNSATVVAWGWPRLEGVVHGALLEFALPMASEAGGEQK